VATARDGGEIDGVGSLIEPFVCTFAAGMMLVYADRYGVVSRLTLEPRRLLRQGQDPLPLAPSVVSAFLHP
jgi:hypothetical protein